MANRLLVYLLVCANLLVPTALAQAPRLALKPVFSKLNLNQPVDAVFYGTRQLLVVERGGKIIDAGTRTAILDLGSQIITSGSEQGLLGLALHPQFPEVSELYVYYTAEPNGRVVVSRFRGQEKQFNRDAEEVLLTISEPYSNHNGGCIRFGPDGYLYLGVGDGGSGGDPHDNGQSLRTLLGKVLRIDVLNGGAYRIPESNPFVSRNGARGEIYAYGLRNPWRFSFDRETGDLWLADVGQNRMEEVDVITSGGNYGWNIMEGTRCFEPSENCDQSGLTLPRAAYGRDRGNSVTGGYVYRGKISALQGWYVFGDFGSGLILGIAPGKGKRDERVLLQSGFNISSFSQDLNGELYLLDYSGGRILRIVKKKTRKRA